MKFSLNWLNDYVDIPCDADTLAEKLSLSGLEVEEIIPIGHDICNITTAKITSITQHPDADRLVVCQLDDGKETHQIVTAATNVFEGAIVPISTPGAILNSGLKIKATKMRGVPSNGMLCSEVELGLAEESEGIMILPDDTPLGVDFVDYANVRDTLLDVAILPNRGDCQSIYGLAREISTLFNIPLKKPDTSITITDETVPFSVSVSNTDYCPIYTARSIRNVTQHETPDWMKRRLFLSGIRPISIVVDITNYVLLECGQPLHAFDQNLIKSGKIECRFAKNGESITTLDGEKRSCNVDTYLITDGENGIALAGIMGANNSEINDDTRDVILESAFFDPIKTRKSASHFGLRTESAIRFEKGVDPESVVNASDRASHLLQTLCEATLHGIVIEKDATQPCFQEKDITFDYNKINQLLGTSITEDKMLEILKNLGFGTEKSGMISVPSFRKNDVTEYPCLAEEILRIHGVDDCPSSLPTEHVTLDEEETIDIFKSKASTFLIQHGFDQVNTFPMISPKDFENFAKDIDDNTIRFLNPLSQDESILRQSTIPSLLNVLRFNHARQQERVFIFEIGKTFSYDNGKPNEEWWVTALASGPKQDKAYGQDADDSLSFNDVKALFSGLTSNLISSNHTDLTLEEEQDIESHLHPVRALSYRQGNKKVAEIGYVHPKITEKYNLNQDVAVINLCLSRLNQEKQGPVTFKPFSKFPSTRRDIAILAPKEMPFNEIYSFINQHKARTVKEVFLFDLFESEKIGSDKKSLAFACVYQGKDKTLEDDAVNKAHQRLCQKIREDLGVIIR